MGVHDAQNGGAGRVGSTGGYTGVVPGWVIPGYPATLLEETPRTAKRAPEAL